MKLYRLASVVVLGLLAGPAAADAASDWNEIAAATTGAGRPGAIGQTDMALSQVAAHDALQSYEKRFEPYYAQIKPVAGSKVAATVAAVYGVLRGFYAPQPELAALVASLDATYSTYLANNGLTGDPGLAVGEAVAAKIVTLRRLNPDPPAAAECSVKSPSANGARHRITLDRRRCRHRRPSRFRSWATFIPSC